MKLQKIQSMRNINRHKRNKYIHPSTLSVKKTNRLINILTNDFNENHLRSMFENNQLIPFEEYNKKIDKSFLDYKIAETDEKMIIKKKGKKKIQR